MDRKVAEGSTRVMEASVDMKLGTGAGTDATPRFAGFT